MLDLANDLERMSLVKMACELRTTVREREAAALPDSSEPA
jgi:hypothetical protein